jgi:hypothetical protein
LSSKYISLDVTGNMKILPIHINCITNFYSLSVLFIIIWKIIVLSMSFIAFQTYAILILALPSNSICFLHLIFPLTFNLTFSRTSIYMFGDIFGSESLLDCYFLVDVRPLVQELFFPKPLGVLPSACQYIWPVHCIIQTQCRNVALYAVTHVKLFNLLAPEF